MWWLLISLLWWCGTAAVPAPGVHDWKCPEIVQQPAVECSCDMPHTLRCNGDKSALQIIGRMLRSLDNAAISLLDCTIQNVSSLPGSLLEGVSLHGLVISSGEIREVNQKTFQGLATPLQALGLPNNMLYSVPTAALRYLPELDRLDLSGNRLKSLDTGSFKGLQNLSFVELSDNVLTKVSTNAFSDLPHLKILRLRGNRITIPIVTKLQELPTLEELDLSENSLTGPLKPDTFPKMPSLRDLQLSHNSLSSIKKEALTGLKNVTSLSLHHNQIDVLEDHAFSRLSTLTSLDLSHNRIVAVSGASLAHLNNLVELDLRHNFLRAFTADLIKPLVSLMKLRLDDNDISIVASDALKPPTKLLRLTLSDNPLNCDCSLQEFASWLANSSLTQEDKSTAVCTTPPSLENGLLFEVPVNSLECGEDDGDVLMEPLAEPIRARINLRNFSYDGASIKLVWNVDKSIPFTCDAIFIYEEEGVNEVLIESNPLKCNSSDLQNSAILNVVVPPVIQLLPEHRYRYCVVLLETLQDTDDSSLILGCSDIIPLVQNTHLPYRSNYAQKLPKVIAIQANFTHGNLSIDMNVYPPSVPCALNVALLEQGALLSQKQLNCTDPRYVFVGLREGPYKVCANVVKSGGSDDKPRCIAVYRGESRGFSNLDVAFVSIFLVLSVTVIALVWGVRRILLKPKVHTHQCFMPPEGEQPQHNRYVKLQATTKL